MDAIILAGGRGTRLAPETAPKCLTHVNGRRIIERLLEHVAPHVEHTVICTGYRATDITVALPAAVWPKISFSFAGIDAPMGERLLKVKADRGFSDRTLVLYGDELADVDIAALVAQHERRAAALTFTGYEQVLPFGVIDSRGWSFNSTAPISSDARVLVNIGFAVVSTNAWYYLQATDGFADFINRVSCDCKSQSTEMFLHTGKRATVNSVAELANAEETWP